jgi:hypothetical protein
LARKLGQLQFTVLRELQLPLRWKFPHLIGFHANTDVRLKPGTEEK